MFLKHKVDGSDYKELPLKVAVYTDCTSYLSDEYKRSKVASIKRYIKKKTSWEIVGWYESSWENGAFNQTGLQALIDDSCTDKFDVIVTTNPGEICVDTIGLALVLRSVDKPIFCKEDETILDEEIVQIDLLQDLLDEMCFNKWPEILEKKRLFCEKF